MTFLFCSSCVASFLSLLRRADSGDTHIIRRFAGLKIEGVIFDILQCSEESEEEKRPGKKVKDPVEDHFARHRNRVPTL